MDKIPINDEMDEIKPVSSEHRKKTNQKKKLDKIIDIMDESNNFKEDIFMDDDIDIKEEHLEDDSYEWKAKSKKREKRTMFEMMSSAPFPSFLSPIKTLLNTKRMVQSEWSPVREIRHESASAKFDDSFRVNMSETQLKTFNKNFNLLKSDFCVLETYEKSFFKGTTLDVMFILDITGSMTMWLKETKSNITNIINDIQDNNLCSRIRMSFVGYRDFNDDNKPVGQYVSLDFTDNIDTVKDFISNVEVYGGGDEPEDVAGALKIAWNMKWESDARYAVLVCDAPCHGKQYHEIIYDKYPEGDPTGLVFDDWITDFVRKNITMYCVEINESTKIMFDTMKNIYKQHTTPDTQCEFHIETWGNSTNIFAFFVAFSASVTLANITYNKFRFEDVVNKFRLEKIEEIWKKYKKDEFDALSDIWVNEIENLELNETDQKMFDFINRMNTLNITNKQEIASMPRDSKPSFKYIDFVEYNKHFMTNKGEVFTAVNHTFQAKINNNIVINWSNPWTIHTHLSSQFTMDRTPSTAGVDYTKPTQYQMCIYDYILSQEVLCSIPSAVPMDNYNDLQNMWNVTLKPNAICNLISEIFNIRLLQAFSATREYIHFDRNCWYEIQNNSVFPTKYLIGELHRLYSDKGTTIPSKKILQTFSHFSYQITEGNILIHNIEIDVDRKQVASYDYSQWDRDGYGSFMKFFVRHYCNDVCKRFGLKHPRKKKELPVDKEFFYNPLDICAPEVCDLCRIPHYLQNEICVECRDKKKFSTKKEFCKTCHASFTYSTFFYKMKMIDHPSQCEDCRGKL